MKRNLPIPAIPRSFLCALSLSLALSLVLTGCQGSDGHSEGTSSPGPVAQATPAGGICSNTGAAWPNAPRCQGISQQSQCCAITAADLSADIPIDVCRFSGFGWTWQQGDLDHFSWLSFVALNWPAQAPPSRGAANTSLRPGATNADGSSAAVVWQSWKTQEDVFPTDGSTPSKVWNEWDAPPPGCPDIPDAPIFTMTSKARPKRMLTASGNLQGFNEAVGGPLVDQAGNLVLYEIYMNETEFGDISGPGYNTGTAVPKGFKWDADKIDEQTGGGTNGVMEVKAAWKQLSDAEWNGGTFYQQEALFYYPGDAQSPSRCDKVKVGLAGLHIAHKVENLAAFTKDDSAWVWTTFEHKGNVPPVSGPQAGASYSFYNSECSPAVDAVTCAALTDLPDSDPKVACCQNLWRWNTIGPGGAPLDMPRTPDQVTRLDALGDGSGCSPVFAKALAGTVWENYALVGTQWTGPKAEGGANVLQPAHLRNTTLETYVVHWDTGGATPIQQNTSSCTGCHASGIDHSFIFPN